MPRRLLMTVITLGLAMAVTAAPVAAGGGSISIGDGGADGEVAGTFRSLDGETTWLAPQPDCTSGAFDLEGASEEIYRFALEFPLTDLPAGATITSATLALFAGGPSLPQPQQAIYGYAGDGSIAEADILVTGTPVLFTPTAIAREDHDVTDLVSAAVVSAGWAGFSIREEPLVDDFESFGCANAGTADFAVPILTITYDLANPATPTPAASLADAATAPPTTGSPLATLGFALLLIGALGALLVANARGVVSRR